MRVAKKQLNSRLQLASNRIYNTQSTCGLPATHSLMLSRLCKRMKAAP